MPGLKWARLSKSWWQANNGKFIARFNWGAAGFYYLLYKSKADYEKGFSNYKSFKTLTEAKSAA